MSSEAVIESYTIDKEEISPYFVYYNEWDGQILRVSRKQQNSIDSFIETSNPVAKKLLKGELNEHEYLVSFIDDVLDIIPRDNKLRLRSSEKTLTQMSLTPVIDWDIRCKIYTVNNKLLVEINPNSIAKLSNMTFKRELMIDDESDLTLYLTEYNNPDFFIKIIDISPTELLDSGNLVFDLTDIISTCNLHKLGILTRRCFKNYYVEILNDSLNVVQDTIIKHRSYVIHNTLNNFKFPHIEIYRNNSGGISVERKVSNTELEDLGLFEDKLFLYVVGETPDYFFGEFVIDINLLKSQKIINYDIDVDLKNINFLHKKHRIIISVKEGQ